jgi:hypothetical protein
VPLHTSSAFYNLEAFKAGATSLLPIELEELGSVEGKTLLHLQCHFGMDTLSWARLGASVTGADFSDQHYPRSILSEGTGLRCPVRLLRYLRSSQ